MKKTYINPTITTIKVVMHQMIAQSPNTPITGNDATQNGDGDYDDAKRYNGIIPGSYNIWEE